MTERERRAFNRGLEKAAKLADLWADENWRMFHHTLLADPILIGTATKDTIVEDSEASKKLFLEGHAHAKVGHACTDLAKMIRDEKLKNK
jgi:hypothetical protein